MRNDHDEDAKKKNAHKKDSQESRIIRSRTRFGRVVVTLSL